MQNTGTRVAIRKLAKAIPGKASAFTPVAQSAVPIPNDMRPERGHTADVAGNSMIAHVALHHLAEPAGHITHAAMHPTT